MDATLKECTFKPKLSTPPRGTENHDATPWFVAVLQLCFSRPGPICRGFTVRMCFRHERMYKEAEKRKIAREKEVEANFAKQHPFRPQVGVDSCHASMGAHDHALHGLCLHEHTRRVDGCCACFVSLPCSPLLTHHPHLPRDGGVCMCACPALRCAVLCCTFAFL